MECPILLEGVGVGVGVGVDPFDVPASMFALTSALESNVDAHANINADTDWNVERVDPNAHTDAHALEEDLGALHLPGTDRNPLASGGGGDPTSAIGSGGSGGAADLGAADLGGGAGAADLGAADLGAADLGAADFGAADLGAAALLA